MFGPGMAEVSKHTGATLVDFVAVGGREVRGGLFYPRRYFVTNAYFDADIIINAANCRSHPNIGLSGAVKNMFGLVLGKRKALMHNLFWDNPYKFGRAIADIHRTIPADPSFLDLTSFREGEDVAKAIRPVGLIFASTDPVALDALAAHAVGYDDLPVWTTYHGGRSGLGCNDPQRIRVCGLEWDSVKTQRLAPPLLGPPIHKSSYDRISNFANQTFLRPRPKICDEKCTGCGDCARRCPISCIRPGENGAFRINLRKCVDCGCCLKVCEVGAVDLEFVDLAGLLRTVTGRKQKRPAPLEG
jgi:ferredoxin